VEQAGGARGARAREAGAKETAETAVAGRRSSRSRRGTKRGRRLPWVILACPGNAEPPARIAPSASATCGECRGGRLAGASHACLTAIQRCGERSVAR